MIWCAWFPVQGDSMCNKKCGSFHSKKDSNHEWRARKNCSGFNAKGNAAVEAQKEKAVKSICSFYKSKTTDTTTGNVHQKNKQNRETLKLHI